MLHRPNNELFLARHAPFAIKFAPMGKNTVKFACHHCGHCCTDVICLPTPWDVVRIVRNTGENPYEFLEFVTPEEIEEVSKNDQAWLECGGEQYMMALRRDERLGCHFLDKKTKYCTIYESRPILCRLYPFRVTEYADGTFKGFVLHKNVGCPKNRDGVYQVKPLYDLYMQDDEHYDDYYRMVRVFNRKRYAGKKPEDFIEMFITGLKPGGKGEQVWQVQDGKKSKSPLA